MKITARGEWAVAIAICLGVLILMGIAGKIDNSDRIQHPQCYQEGKCAEDGNNKPVRYGKP